MALDPSDPNTLYIATNYLYRWNELTQSVDARLGGVSLSKTGWINGIAVASADSNRIYTCSNGGEVYMSKDRGSHWTEITGNLPVGSFNTISAGNPGNANDVLVGIETPSSGGRLWRCTNPTSAGPAWIDVSGSASGQLPPAPVHAIVRDPTDPALIWYVATTVGVYRTSTAGSEWKEWWTSLAAPVVEVRDLILVGKRLRAGTFGRGIWEYFPGILQLFYRGIDTAVWSRWRNPDGTWSGEQRLGGSLAGNVVVAVIPGTSVLQLFYIGMDSAVWSRWRHPDGTWSDEHLIGGKLAGDSLIAAVVPGTNVLQLFYRGMDSAVWSRWRHPDGTWSDEHLIGGKFIGGSLACAFVPGTNVLQLFYCGTDLAVRSRWRHPDGTWSDEHLIGGAGPSSVDGMVIAAVLPD